MTGADDTLAQSILRFWFDAAHVSVDAARLRSKAWFTADPAFDAELAQRFGDCPARALAGELDAWSSEPEPALALLRRRHLVLFASLRETVLSRTLSAPVRDLDGALTHAAAADYLAARRASFNRLERAGALMLDVEPQELPLALVNRYLDVKRSGAL